MKKDIGSIEKIGNGWYVKPYRMKVKMLRLHPIDIRSFDKGYCFTDPKGLDVCFELSYIKRKGRDHDVYARIISEAEYNIPLV
jgi:hypothetical protein